MGSLKENPQHVTWTNAIVDNELVANAQAVSDGTKARREDSRKSGHSGGRLKILQSRLGIADDWIPI